LKFNFYLSLENKEIKRTCKQLLFTASQNLLKEIHSVAKKELITLMGNLGSARIEATRDLGKEAAESMVKDIKLKISKVKADLVSKEIVKLGKAIQMDIPDVPVVQAAVNINMNNNVNNEVGTKKRNGRFNKKIRLNIVVMLQRLLS